MKKILESLKGIKKQSTAILATLAAITIFILLCKYSVWMWNLIM